MTGRALVIALPLVLAACGTGAGEAPNVSAAGDLAGTSWILATIDVADADIGPGVAGDAELTLTFEDGGRASGSTGCNRFAAQWTQDGEQLSISVGAVTQAACATDELQTQEAAYLRALGSVERAEVTADALVLVASGGVDTLEFAAAIADLAGSSWLATGVNNQTGGVESTALTSTVTADFGDDGVMTGFSGCRAYSASYDATAAEITISDVSLDGPACTADEASLEANYVAALENAATFSIDGSSLNLRDADGATQVNYSLRS